MGKGHILIEDRVMRKLVMAGLVVGLVMSTAAVAQNIKVRQPGRDVRRA